MRLKRLSISQRDMPRQNLSIGVPGMIGAAVTLVTVALVALIITLLSFVACRRDSGRSLEQLMVREDRVFSQRCYAGELHEWDMVGIWLLDADCVPNLIKTAGFQKYTNRTDHVIVLNTDGSAIARMAYEYSYVVARSRTLQEECDGYEKWKAERLESILEYPSGGYYIWNPGGLPPISGPFRDKPDADGCQILKTNKTQWRLVWRSWHDYGLTGWFVEFNLPGVTGPVGGMKVGVIDNRLCLYMTSHDAWPLDERTQTFRFSKVTEADLQRITRETVNEGEVGDRVD